MCVCVYFWWHLTLTGFFFPEKDTFQFDVALLITSITRKKYFSISLSAVYSPWKNLCIAQNQANASPLITRAPPRHAQQSSLSEGSQPSSLVNNPVCWFLFCNCHAVPGTLSLGTMSHKRCKLFSSKKKKKQICGLAVYSVRRSERVFVRVQ